MAVSFIEGASLTLRSWPVKHFTHNRLNLTIKFNYYILKKKTIIPSNGEDCHLSYWEERSK